MQRKDSISVKVPVAYSAGVFCGDGRTGEIRAAFGEGITFLGSVFKNGRTRKPKGRGNVPHVALVR